MRWLDVLFRRPVARPHPPAFVYSDGRGRRSVDPVALFTGLDRLELLDLKATLDRLKAPPAGDRAAARDWSDALDRLVGHIDGLLDLPAEMSTRDKLTLFRDLTNAVLEAPRA